MENKSSIFIGFSYPKKFKIGAWLISKWLGTSYSHVYIRFPEGRISSTVYHAARGMVHFRTQENFLKENEVIKEYELTSTDKAKQAVLQHCMNLSGEKYGYSELFKILAIDACDKLGCKRFTTYDGVGYICSELVGTIMSDLMLVVWSKAKYLLTPKDIEDKLKEELNK